MSEHARFSPSASDRWVACIKSITLSEAIPAQPSGSAAAAGSLMHEVFERLLLGQDHLRPAEIEELDIYDFSEKVARKLIDEGVQAARASLKQHKIKDFLTERRVYPGRRINCDTLWGTADLIGACEHSKTLLIGDFKSGRGLVRAEFNSQLAIYALGCLDLIDFVPEKIVFGIYQPAIRGVNPDTWVCTLEDLLEYEKTIAEKIAMVDDPDLKPEPSPEACRWCPARFTCEAAET